ncbi:hypothetical protein FEM48_Zijuj09G0216200 [Ziziphus jujuba var. spinosa]|uniref:Uncharacterized protein n=1 Tax=Ziziphus jujuba var. spinosa TaxID=714518 RepID=A0A978UVG2_ZIZJJ|nr:hypothetical protein FEM48_Zijuj09G0216200 [Ziziphus jujuba var. spinosa]
MPETLDLSRNQHLGPIPVSMPPLTFMNHLNLSYNNLSGKIPTANQFQTLMTPSLYKGNVHLSGWRSKIDCQDSCTNSTPIIEEEDRDGTDGSWRQLDRLDIAYNQLSGRVPNSFRFNKESTAKLTTNRFQGPLPLWSSNVTELYLGDNQFLGPIPPSIGEVMPLLTDLDVSYNSLSGSIPLSIGNITGLMNLVISNNELSGTEVVSRGCRDIETEQLTDRRWRVSAQ